MSKKSFELFMQHLEKENLKQINPRAFTAKELVLFGRIRGFNFTVNELQEKMNVPKGQFF